MSFVRDAKMSASKWEILPFDRRKEGAPNRYMNFKMISLLESK